MTEAEWLAASQVPPMLQFLGKRAGVRKRRLFACACVRRIWHLLDDPRSQRAVETSEAFADGELDRETVKRMRMQAHAASRLVPRDGRSPDARGLTWSAADAAEICLLLTTEDISTAARAVTAASRSGAVPSRERAAQSSLLRDIFGNPFRPVRIDPSWQTPNVVALARTIYDERELPSGLLDRTRLAVLADALLDAGCEDEAILDHCRSEGPHVRGCWVLDLLLGKG